LPSYQPGDYTVAVDVRLTQDRLKRLDQYLTTLRKLAQVPRSTLIEDAILRGSAERYLQLAIEVCLDIANHVIAAEGHRSPRDYADAFCVLTEAGILPTEFLPVAQRMARFRNRLVHLYWEVDAETVYEILQTRLDDFDRFKGFILAHIVDQGSARAH